MPEFVTELQGTSPCSLIKQCPETGTVIHLHQMCQFMLHDIILQMRRKKHQVQTEADITIAAATAPPGTAVMDAYLPIAQPSGLGQDLQSRRKDGLSLTAQPLNLLGRKPQPGCLTLRETLYHNAQARPQFLYGPKQI